MDTTATKALYRMILGHQSKHVEDAIEHGYIGVHFDVTGDLSEAARSEDKIQFRDKRLPELLTRNPDRTKGGIAKGLGMVWTVVAGMKPGDLVMTFRGNGNFAVGVIEGGYRYVANHPLPHQRSVRWLDQQIAKDSMTVEFRNSAHGPVTVSNLSGHVLEALQLLGDAGLNSNPSGDYGEANQVGAAFVLEKYLEDFLVSNWAHTELGKGYSIYEENGETVGQQFLTDTGPLDILAVSKDGKELLVVELKRGRASDAVVGQIQRYMGYIAAEVAKPGQVVKGAIVALDDDLRIRRALSVAPGIRFFTYEISFRLNQR